MTTKMKHQVVDANLFGQDSGANPEETGTSVWTVSFAHPQSADTSQPQSHLAVAQSTIRRGQDAPKISQRTWILRIHKYLVDHVDHVPIHKKKQ